MFTTDVFAPGPVNRAACQSLTPLIPYPVHHLSCSALVLFITYPFRTHARTRARALPPKNTRFCRVSKMSPSNEKTPAKHEAVAAVFSVKNANLAFVPLLSSAAVRSTSAPSPTREKHPPWQALNLNIGEIDKFFCNALNYLYRVLHGNFA